MPRSSRHVENKPLNAPPRLSPKLSTYSVFAATAFVMPPLCMLSPNAVVILLLVQAALFLWTIPRRQLLDSMPWPLVAVLAAFVLWSLASVGWSLIWGHSLTKVGE